jgi:hypothetical protein
MPPFYLRYLFGLRDTKLALGAVGANATRHSPMTIEADVSSLIKQELPTPDGYYLFAPAHEAMMDRSTTPSASSQTPHHRLVLAKP